MSEERESSRESHELVRELVRELLVEALRARRGGRLGGEAIRARTRAICESAHRRGVPIEQVLVEVKQQWRETAETRHLRRFEATTVLERLVTLCISEFYADTTTH